MTSHYETIRKALEYAQRQSPWHAAVVERGFAALAKLERASKEPVARVYWSNQTDCLSVTYDDYMKLPPPGSLLYAAPPAPAAPGMFTAEEMESAFYEGLQANDCNAIGRKDWLGSATFKLIQERTP